VTLGRRAALFSAAYSTDSARPSSSSERYSTVLPSNVTRVVPPVKAAASTDARVPAGCASAHAGSVILEPGLTPEDLRELVAAGVWLAKAGFGGFATPFDYAPVMLAARAVGMITTMHTGGSSIPGS